ncbi:MAG TPA: UbiA family prenyltransferase, partial [Bacteroidia bacterium]|nr:UbiA family prenyltransferase [Bacteroidia bacterium]
MPSKFLEKPTSIAYKAIDFIGYSNIYISLCAASLTALSQKIFLQKISFSFLSLTFCATFLLYNMQRMYLSFFRTKPYSITGWQYRQKYLLLFLMLVSMAGLYPVLQISKQNMEIYFISFCLGIFYFLPFSNWRAIPVIKSFTVGAVWVLVCVVAPLEEYDWNTGKIFFCIAQLFFISALCVLFNIRDMEEDSRSKTHSVPVLFGIVKTRIFNYGVLICYLILMLFVQVSAGFCIMAALTFFTSCVFTRMATLKNHPFYYTFGVDGIILLQSLLGFLCIRYSL